MCVKNLLQQRTNITPEVVTGSHLEKQVDELLETVNDIAKMLGKENLAIDKEIVAKTAETELKKV